MRGDRNSGRGESERSYRERRENHKNRQIPGSRTGAGRPVSPEPNAYRNLKKRRRKWPVVLFVILLLLAAAAAAVFFIFGRIDTQTLHSLVINDGASTGQKGTQTIVIYGVDSREGNLTKECHSDTIMICNIDHKSRELKLASVYRDTYLDNTNGEYRKATECYYFGGPERSVNMLNTNLDLNIRDYIAVNFNAMVEVADLLGGIDLEITEEEMGYINGYCVETSQVTGVP